MHAPPHSFALGPLVITFYGLLVTLGAVVGLLLTRKRARVYGISIELLDDFLPELILVVLIGARVYHVLDKWSYYQEHMFQILAVWQGGLAIYGAVTAGIAYTYWFVHIRHHQPILPFLDLLAPSVLLAQAIGRWGNFFNQEAFGPPTTLPWRIFIDPPHRPMQWQEQEFFHPLFLYESLWNLIGFIVLWRLGPKVVNHPGFIFGLYCMWYGLGRLLIEQLRFDTASFSGIKIATVFSIGLFCTGAYVLLPFLPLFKEED